MDELRECPFCGGTLELSWHSGEDCYLCDCCGVRISLPQGSITHLTDIVNRRHEPENKPLTLDELSDMVDEPVFIQLFGDLAPGYWSVITQVDEHNVWFENGLHERFSHMGDTWLAYRNKPKEKTL